MAFKYAVVGVDLSDQPVLYFIPMAPEQFKGINVNRHLGPSQTRAC
jgi:hypothetical protein